MEGSYTVEAAFLMPIILGIAFALLYTMFVLHDRIVLQANMSDLLLQAAEKEEEEPEGERASPEKGLWCMKLTEYSLNKGRWRLTAELQAEAEWNVPVLSYFLRGKQCCFLEQNCLTLHPETVMRSGADIFASDREPQTK